jgi:hypothetical protein
VYVISYIITLDIWPVALPFKPSTNRREVQDCVNGYPRVAAFLDSDDNFMICRRFGYLHWRVLLDKQNELQYLEKELDEMDKDKDKANPGCLRGSDVNIAGIAEGQLTERQAIMKDINNTLLEYSNFDLQSLAKVKLKFM